VTAIAPRVLPVVACFWVVVLFLGLRDERRVELQTHSAFVSSKFVFRPMSCLRFRNQTTAPGARVVMHTTFFSLPAWGRKLGSAVLEWVLVPFWRFSSSPPPLRSFRRLPSRVYQPLLFSYSCLPLEAERLFICSFLPVPLHPGPNPVIFVQFQAEPPHRTYNPGMVRDSLAF